MGKRKLTDEEFLRALREVDSGNSVATICATYAISRQTFYARRKRYLFELSDNHARSGVQHVRFLREENAKLRALVASLSLDRQIFKEIAARRIQFSR